MRHRMLWTATLVLFFAVGVVAVQDKPRVHTVGGLVAKVGETMLVVDVGDGKSLQFITSATTTVKCPPGTGGSYDIYQPGKPRLKITDVVFEGDQVPVKYTDVSGKPMAQSIDLLKCGPLSKRPGR